MFHVNIINSSLTKEQTQHIGAKTVFSTNCLGTTGHPHAKKTKNLPRDRIPSQKLTQNEPET